MIKNFTNFTNENYNFFDTKDDGYVTKCDKKQDLKIRELKPKTGDWVNFKSEYGDVWHKIIKVYEPDNYYGTVYYYTAVNSKSEKVKESYDFYFNISKISKDLPNDARCFYDETGSYREI